MVVFAQFPKSVVLYFPVKLEGNELLWARVAAKSWGAAGKGNPA